MKLFLRKNIVFILLLLALSVSILILALGSFPGLRVFLYDIGLNFTTEILGIAVTVLIIERLLKNYEEGRWENLRNQIYAKLMSITYEILYYFIPPSKRKIPDKVVVFGDSIPSQNLSTNYMGFTEYQDQVAAVITYSRITINEIIDLNGFLLSPEILTSLQKLKSSLDNMSSKRFDDTNEVSAIYGLELFRIEKEAASLQLLLMTKKTNVTTYEQLNNDLEVKIKKMQEELLKKG